MSELSGVALARVGCSPAAGAGANRQPEEDERFYAACMLLLLLYSLLAVTYQTNTVTYQFSAGREFYRFLSRQTLC